MLNIDRSIRILISKFHINLNEYPIFFRSVIINKLWRMCNEILEGVDDNEIILWGPKAEIEVYKEYVNVDNNQKIFVCLYTDDVIDTGKLLDEEIEMLNGKTVFVFGERVHRILERKWFGSILNNQAFLVDIYDYFGSHGVQLEQGIDYYSPYKNSFKKKLKCNIQILRQFIWKKGYGKFGYVIFNLLRKRIPDNEDAYAVKMIFEQDISKKQREYNLRLLIWQYYQMRDFINARKYCLLYEQGNYDYSVQYTNFSKELDTFLKLVKCELRKKQDKDIVANWIDSIEYQKFLNADGFSYLRKEAETSLFFDAAYSVMPWTQPVFKTILTGKLPIDDHLFDIKRIGIKQSKIISLLKNYKYKFIYNGAVRFNSYLETKYCYNDVIKRLTWMPTSLLQWNTLCIIAKSRKPVFILTHNIYETHPPFYYGDANKLQFNYSDEDVQTMGDQELAARKYIDEQLEWYESFHSKEVVHLYFSDHGFLPEYGTLDEKRNHIFFFAKWNNMERIRVKKLISLKDFDKIVKYILAPTKENFEDMCSEYVFGQTYDYYSKEAVDRTIRLKLDKRFYMQQRGIRTLDEQFILTADGNEFYFRLPDEVTNYIHDPIYYNRIEYLRKINGCYFIDIFKYDYFKNSRKFYK